MKILIDEGLSTYGRMSGIGHVSFSLWKHLQKYTNCDITDYSYLGNLPRSIRRPFYMTAVNIKRYFSDYDIIHYTNHYAPKPKAATLQVCTIHDLTAFKHPDSLPKSYLPYIQRSLKNIINRVSAIVTPSESIKSEIIGMFDLHRNIEMKVCLNGVRDLFYTQQSEADIIQTLSSLGLLANKYFIFVGTLEKRKNTSFLIKTFIEAHFNAELSKETKLVLIGKAGFGFDEIIKNIDNRNVLWFNNINQTQLLSLYKKSKALIFPSLYEGFGIPIAEAMVTGVPIIASNISTNLEFNKRHNNQIKIFELGNKESLRCLLSDIDKEDDPMSQLNYGDVTIYKYDNVARQHYELYKLILNKDNKEFI
jgi:glycosyltransferase involved in cell wall biosynthesis